MNRLLSAALASLLALPAWSQSADRPLNLKLPPAAATAPAAPAKAAPTHDAPAPGSTAPGVYYGDTSGTTDAAIAANEPPADTCDDATYNQPQVHGSVGMGVVTGSGVHGNYQAGSVSLSKALGACDHPSGGGRGSIGTGRGRLGRWPAARDRKTLTARARRSR